MHAVGMTGVRDRCCGWRIGIMPLSVLTPSIFAGKGEEPKPEHVERSQKRCDQSDQPVDPAGLIRAPQDFVFAEETSQRRNTSDRNCSDSHGPKVQGIFFRKPPILRMSCSPP